MYQLQGTYRASTNLTYEYDATWREHSAGLLWSATILQEHKALAHREGLVPSGTVERVEPESLVRTVIHEAIEILSRAT